jgi:hypothetical protein
MRGYLKYSSYYDYVENVVKKCSLYWMILESRSFRSYKFAKEYDVNAKLLPGKHLKITPARCKSYSCPICGKKKVYDLMDRLRRKNLKGYRFFTLTMKNNYNLDDTENNLNRVSKCFNKLDKRLRKQKQFKGLEYLRVIEIGSRGMVHIHGIWNKYIPVKTLSEYWGKITGDSYRVDLRRVKCKEDCYAYILKYMTKNVVNHDQFIKPTLVNMDPLNSAALFYENRKRRLQASKKFFNKIPKKESEYLPCFFESQDDDSIDRTLTYIIKEYDLNLDNIDFTFYDSRIIKYRLFNKGSPP